MPQMTKWLLCTNQPALMPCRGMGMMLPTPSWSSLVAKQQCLRGLVAMTQHNLKQLPGTTETEDRSLLNKGHKSIVKKYPHLGTKNVGVISGPFPLLGRFEQPFKDTWSCNKSKAIQRMWSIPPLSVAVRGLKHIHCFTCVDSQLVLMRFSFNGSKWSLPCGKKMMAKTGCVGKYICVTTKVATEYRASYIGCFRPFIGCSWRLTWRTKIYFCM